MLNSSTAHLPSQWGGEASASEDAPAPEDAPKYAMCARVRARILWRYSLEQRRKQFWVELFSLINTTTRVVHSFQGPHVGKVHYTSNLWSKRGHIE